eukprot:1161487-Pelagomonas_calceolata.AAC.8
MPLLLGLGHSRHWVLAISFEEGQDKRRTCIVEGKIRTYIVESSTGKARASFARLRQPEPVKCNDAPMSPGRVSCLARMPRPLRVADHLAPSQPVKQVHECQQLWASAWRSSLCSSRFLFLAITEALLLMAPP